MKTDSNSLDEKTPSAKVMSATAVSFKPLQSTSSFAPSSNLVSSEFAQKTPAQIHHSPEPPGLVD